MFFFVWVIFFFKGFFGGGVPLFFLVVVVFFFNAHHYTVKQSCRPLTSSILTGFSSLEIFHHIVLCKTNIFLNRSIWHINETQASTLSFSLSLSPLHHRNTSQRWKRKGIFCTRNDCNKIQQNFYRDVILIFTIEISVSFNNLLQVF